MTSRMFKSATVMKWAVIGLSLLLSACALRGPGATRASRLAYNDALQISEKRELLLNLVRLRYADSPEFITISGISTQFNFQASVGYEGEYGKDGDDNNALTTPSASVEYFERPTVSLSPQRDDEFTREMMTPVDIEVLYLLAHYGWDIDRVLNLTARHINGVGTTSYLPLVSGTVGDEKLMHRLTKAGVISVMIEKISTPISNVLPTSGVSTNDFIDAANEGYTLDYQTDPPGYVVSEVHDRYVLRIADEAWDDEGFKTLGSLLNLQHGDTRFVLQQGDLLSQVTEPTIRIGTRSVLESMAYLANGVEVHESHSVRGFATPHIDTDIRHIFRVAVADDEPNNAYLSVPYRGHWYYIAGEDLKSRETFTLIDTLFRLTVNTDDSSGTPVLTLPVGG